MSTPQVSVIIPVFNQWAFTEQCLRSLKEHTPQRIQVIVVDNASTDQTARELDTLGRQLWGEDFTSAHLPENQGFARACNHGARLAQREILFFLNNDTLLTPGWLPPLLDTLERDQNLAAVGPLLLYPGSNLVQHLGLAFLPGPEVTHLYDYFPATHPLVMQDRRSRALTAAALCLAQKTFWTVDGFFEGYRNGCEDIDLCLNLGQKGLGLRCVARSRILHFTSKSEGRFEHDSANSSLLVQRHGPRLKPDIHMHAARDGYAIVLNEWLLASPDLNPRRKKDLSARAAGGDPQLWADLLDEEPFWTQGYTLLADWLEARDAHPEALHFRSLAAHFQPSRAAYMALARTARKAGSEDIAAHAASQLQTVAALLEGVRHKAARRVRWARDAGERFWEKLYADWLVEHDRETIPREQDA
jgi:hypothetical protein